MTLTKWVTKKPYPRKPPSADRNLHGHRQILTTSQPPAFVLQANGAIRLSYAAGSYSDCWRPCKPTSVVDARCTEFLASAAHWLWFSELNHCARGNGAQNKVRNEFPRCAPSDRFVRLLCFWQTDLLALCSSTLTRYASLQPWCCAWLVVRPHDVPIVSTSTTEKLIIWPPYLAQFRVASGDLTAWNSLWSQPVTQRGAFALLPGPLPCTNLSRPHLSLNCKPVASRLGENIQFQLIN